MERCYSCGGKLEVVYVPESLLPRYWCYTTGCPVNSLNFGADMSMDNKSIHNTTVDIKREHWVKFAELMSNQFNHGGDKYKIPGFEDREATDIISAVFGGTDQNDWVLGTMMKYLFRFKNFKREKDLLKIATYCYILWLKNGFHLNQNHDEDTNKSGDKNK